MDENNNINEEIIDIEIDSAFPYTAENGALLNHSYMYGREFSNQHPIEAITGLEDELKNIKSVKQVYSTQSGISEFRKWDDGNADGEDRSGYFVTIVEGTENVSVCTVTSDVYGVSVTRASAGFIGNQNEYDKSDDFSYAVVSIVGAVRVRTDGTARIGEYVIPNAYGEATLSENGNGYKVLSQGSYSSYNYVTIAFVPQSDMLGGGGSGSGTGSGDLSEIIVQIEQLDKKTEDTYQIAIDTSNMTKEEIAAIQNEVSTMGTRVLSTEEKIKDVTDVANEAASKADSAVESANSLKQDAIDAANGAINEARNAATLASNLADQMNPILSWPEGSDNPLGVAGFVKQAEEDHMTLASIMSGSNENGTSLSAIVQRLDEHGAIINHLVYHVDKYSVGSKSISDGLTYEDAKSLLTDTHVYVSTVTHEETMDAETPVKTTFEKDYVYTWIPFDDADSANTGKWVKSAETINSTPSYTEGSAVGDLWFCFEDVERKNENDEVVDTYIAGTLYRWYGTEWVAVATTGENDRSKILSSVTQTASDIKMVVNNYGDEGSTFQQNLEGIFTTVQDSDNYISAIEQTAKEIKAGTYSPDDTASYLELFAADTSAGLSAVASGRFQIVYQSFLGEAPEVYEGCSKYSQPPVWDDNRDVFVFDENSKDDNGDYYFSTEDQTKYCAVTSDGYDIYTLCNKATSLLDSRISEAEAILTGSVEYATTNSTAFAGIVAKADDNAARIDSIASYYYHTRLSISDTEIPVCSPYKYINPPEWDAASGEYKFDIADRSDEGIYYLADNQGSTYCKVVTTGDGQTLYEIYGLAGSYMSSITQGADEDGGYIQSIVMDIERYNVGQFSQSYGMSYDDAVEVIPEGTMYVPTVAHSENLMRDELGDVNSDTEVLNAGTLEDREANTDIVYLPSQTFDALEVIEMQTYDFEVEEDKTYRYIWNGLGWEKGAAVSMSTVYFDGSEDNDLWYCIQDVFNPQESVSEGTDGIYRAGTLYAWKGGRWFAIATTHDSLLSRSISLVRQTADSYSVEIRSLKGDFSEYKQTTDYISQTVGGADGSIGNLTLTKEGIAGEVYNRTGNSATLKAQADSTQAVMDLMISGVYHKLEQPLTSKVPEPYGEGAKYFARPEWVASLGRFVFYTEYENEDGAYYFFDEDQTHYCKVVGDQYEVYTIGTLSTAGTDAHITEEYAAINTLAYYGDDETSTIAGLRTLALESKAQVELLASLDRNKLHSVVNVTGYKPEGARYSEKPTYDDGVFVFDSTKQDDEGLYFLIGAGDQFGKLIYSNSGICTGYEVYEYDNSNTAGLISTVLSNQASVGLLVTDGVANGSLIIEAINGETEAVISADRISVEGVLTVNDLSTAGKTVINGSNITTGVIDSENYSYTSGNFSTDGTAFDLTDGSITSKNFAIDADGNLYLKRNINAGLASDGTYNFMVDEYGNVTVKGTLDANDLKVNGESVLTGDDKISADYLELKGLTITDSSGRVTFEVDSYGNVYIRGDVDMSVDSVITWESIKEDVQAIADDAADDAIKTLANGSYTSGTFISGKSIYSPTIYSNNFEVQPNSKTSSGGLSIYGYFNNTLQEAFSVYYQDVISAPVTTISTYGYLKFDSSIEINSECSFSFSRNSDYPTYVYGNVDFSGATVTGLSASSTAVFG